MYLKNKPQEILQINSFEDKLDAIVANATVDSEVILAREGKATLKERLNFDKSEVMSGLADIATNTGLPATNLNPNGDYSNGIVNWQGVNATISALNNELTVLASANGGHARGANITTIVGNKYYMKALIKSTSNLVKLNASGTLGVTPHSGSGNYENISSVIIAPSTLIIMRITDNRASGWDNYYIKNALMINLTATFGENNEPTATEMDAILSKFPNGWFDGSIEQLLTLKEIWNYMLKKKVDIAPIASYIYTGNKEIVITSVDIDTDIFTCVGHGLVNNEKLIRTLNINAGLVYPINVFAGNLPSVYLYVVNATADTFQLSLTNGGVPINITANANIDLTKWHFERIVATTTIEIANLPSAKKYRVKVKGKLITNSATGIYPSNTYLTNWLQATVYSYPVKEINANVFFYSDVIIDMNSIATIIGSIDAWYENSSIANSYLKHDICMYSPAYFDGAITGVVFKHTYGIVNGTIMEVFNV